MSSRPQKIDGGCLCGTVRYTINITPDIAWPPTHNGTCQCTMCRKFGGALFQNGCTFPSSAITPPLARNSAYTTYNSSEKAFRGFCRICGSSLTFNYKDKDETEILLGSVDEKVLKSQTGTELCDTKTHGWCSNAVKGVTDNLPGEMFQE